MVFTKEDKALIKKLYLIKGYTTETYIRVSCKGWKRAGLHTTNSWQSCIKRRQLSASMVVERELGVTGGA